MTTFVGYLESPQFRIDIEHPASSVVFGAEMFDDDTGTSVEYKYTYGTGTEITKLPVPVIAGGESYVLTLPPVTEGRWVISAMTNYGAVVHTETFRVLLPDNSKLYTVTP